MPRLNEMEKMFDSMLETLTEVACCGQGVITFPCGVIVVNGEDIPGHAIDLMTNTVTILRSLGYLANFEQSGCYFLITKAVRV